MDYIFHLTYIVFLVLIIISDLKASSDNLCANGKCVKKCCPGKAYIFNDECVSSKKDTFKDDFSDVDVYDENLLRTGSLKDVFKIVDGELYKVIPNGCIRTNCFNVYLLKNGNLHFKLSSINTFPRIEIIKNDKFCVDYMKNEDDKFTPTFAVVEETSTKNMSFPIISLIISCIFLLLVLIIYASLKELRNVKGRILMAMVVSLLGAFSVLATYQIKSDDDDYSPTNEECFGFTCTIYFFFLSAFCWMNVMSFDIWLTLRTIRTRRTIRGENNKFLTYCLYAWGLPVVMTIALRVIDESDLSRTPWIIKPNIISGGCFISADIAFVLLLVLQMSDSDSLAGLPVIPIKNYINMYVMYYYIPADVIDNDSPH